MAPTTVPAFDATNGVAEANLCNIALAKIGVEPILDTTEDSEAARACRRQYARTRDELLRDYDFNFSINIGDFDEDAVYTQLGKWSYAYDVPTGTVILRIIEVDNDPNAEFEFRDGHLLSNLYTVDSPRSLQVRYIVQVTDPADFDVVFSEALTLRVASKICFSITGKFDLAQGMQAEFAAIISQAGITSSKEKFTEEGETLWTERDAI
jgi:hypothetical protein